MARLIPQVPGMLYSHTNDDVYCAFYASSLTDIPLEAGKVNLHQQTDYPFDGTINIGVHPETDDMEFTLWLRIPTWCNDRFVPGELYSYVYGGGTNYSKINTTMTTLGWTFGSRSFWSSSEYNSNYAWDVTSNDGIMNYYTKNGTISVSCFLAL